LTVIARDRYWGHGTVRAAHASTLTAIPAALEAAGVESIAENGGGAGVRLKKRE
jgi:hypothetical protein